MTMPHVPREEIDIVGFEGSFVVECGQGLPVALHRQTKRYFKLDDTDPAPPSYVTGEEIRAQERARVITRLPEPLARVPHGMVLFATAAFLRTAGLAVPGRVEDQTVAWQVVEADGQQAQVAYLAEPLVRAILDDWGRHLRRQSYEALLRYYDTKQEPLVARAEELADLGICAALDPDLREDLYKLLGLAMLLSEADELENWHSCIIHPEFPYWTWDGFLRDVTALADKIRAAADVRRPPAPGPAKPPVPDRRRRNPVAHLGDRLMLDTGAVKLSDLDLELLKEAAVNNPKYYMKLVKETDKGPTIMPSDFTLYFGKAYTLGYATGRLSDYIVRVHGSILKALRS